MAPQVQHYRASAPILSETRAFLHQRGLEGCEGMLLWIGIQRDQRVQITRVFIPEQRCVKTRFGVAVELTPHAHYTLPDTLREAERFYARVHSHPTEAFHSHRDDQNAVLTHEGALSIVVPDFAARPVLNLADCAIYQLEYGKGWVRLDQAAIAQRIEVVL